MGKKAITMVLGCLVVIAILMSAVSASVFALQNSDVSLSSIVPEAVDNNVVKVTIEERSITAFNEKGKVSWIKNLRTDIACHVLCDSNKDGVNEIILGTDHKGDNPGTVYVFDSNGIELWKYKVGTGCREVFHRSETFIITHILVNDLSGDDKKEVLVNSHNVPWYPNKLLLFNVNGSVIGEYWHPGHVKDVKVADINNDGCKEIVGGGVNNDLGYIPIVFVLDPQNVIGQAPPYYGNAPQASEKNYKQIPKSEVSPEGSIVTKISFDAGRIVASIDDGRFFYYDSCMNHVRTGYSDGYIRRIKEIEEGKEVEKFERYLLPFIWSVIGATIGVVLGNIDRILKKLKRRKK